MSWKCVCNHVNENDQTRCQNCNRSRPKYLGVSLDVASNDALTNTHFGVWYLRLAYKFLVKAEVAGDAYDQLRVEKKNASQADSDYQRYAKRKLEKLEKEVREACSRSISMLDKVMDQDPKAQIEDRDSRVMDVSSLEGSCYFILGDLEFSKGTYAKAIEYYQKSFDIDPSQHAIYNIAMATKKLPAEGGGGGIFGGGKKQAAAAEEKKKQEIRLLIKAVKFAPFSRLGIESAAVLLEDYNIVMTPENF